MKNVIFIILIVLLYSCGQEENVIYYPESQVKIVTDVTITAYTASKDECGKDDGIGAYNIKVWPGTVACNFLPKGTLVRIPELFGDKTFIVLDKLKTSNMNNVDVFVNKKRIAFENIGRKHKTIEVIGEVKLTRKQLAMN